MTHSKPLQMRWSGLALDTAGHNRPALQAKIFEEITQFLPDARSWLLHVYPRGEPGPFYLLTGEESPDAWEVACQLAKLRPMRPSPDEHSDPRMSGKVVNFPEALDDADNFTFFQQ